MYLLGQEMCHVRWGEAPTSMSKIDDGELTW